MNKDNGYSGAKGPDCNPDSKNFQFDMCGTKQQIIYNETTGCAYNADGSFLSSVNGNQCAATLDRSDSMRGLLPDLDIGNLGVATGVTSLFLIGVVWFRLRRRR